MMGKIKLLAACLFPVIGSSIAQNLVPSDSWTVGSGSVGIFNQNGNDYKNVREWGINPFGEQAILWKAIADAANSSDGGWYTQNFPVVHSKTHRFAVWIKKTNSNNGHTYLGPSANNNILNLNGTPNSNPYFFVGDLPSLDQWYLVVGYVHGSGDPSTQSYGGIYDPTTGVKVVSLTDFKFASSATTASHRAFLYYDTDTGDRQYFYDPQVYQLEGLLPLEETAAGNLKNGEVYFNKNLGIGTSNPSGELHIHGAHPSIYLTSSDWAALRGNQSTWLFGYTGTQGSEDISIGTQDETGSRTLTFAAGGVARMKILNNGNVGIGTTNPDYKLTVKGKIHAEEIKVDLSVPGPDYVFDEDYQLTSLDDLKQYIAEHKHLPEIPSAKEMEANGINLMEMNILLLKKIEELTLYQIKTAEELKKAKTRISRLEKNQCTNK